MNDTRPIQWTDLDLATQEAAIASVIRRARVSRSQAEDAVSDAVAKLMHLRPVAQSPQALLVRAALNLLADQRKREQRAPRLFAIARDLTADELEAVASSEPDPAEEVAENEGSELRSAEIRAALDQLSLADRLLLTACYFEGRSIEAIEKGLGIKRGAGKVRLCRARQRLRAILDETEGGSERSG